jgi:hypothetical protein
MLCWRATEVHMIGTRALLVENFHDISQSKALNQGEHLFFLSRVLPDHIVGTLR